MDFNSYSKNGLYLYKRYNMIPIMIYSIHYDEIFILEYEEDYFIDLRKWSNHKNKYLVNDKKYIKADTNFVGISGNRATNTDRIMKITQSRSNNYKIYYLVQKQYFKRDCVSVNLPSKIEMMGTMRIKGLCAYKIYHR